MEQRPFVPFANYDGAELPALDTAGKYAYAIVLGTNPDAFQHEIYFDAVRVLVRSLKKSGTGADVIVLKLNKEDHEDAILEEDGAIIKHVDPIDYGRTSTHFEPWFVDIALAKLHAFGLTDYDRVQVLDADIAIQEGRTLDDLFLYTPKSRLVAEGLGTDSPLRAGWLLAKPSNTDYQNIKDLASAGQFNELSGWEERDLPVDYPGWNATKAVGWDFYGADLEQGLLFHYFYSVPKSNDAEYDNAELLVLLNDETLLSFGIVHFYGPNRKPWASRKVALPPHIKLAQERWLSVYESLLSKDQLPSRALIHLDDMPSEMPSQMPSQMPSFTALTEEGIQHYTEMGLFYDVDEGEFEDSLEPSEAPSSEPSSEPSSQPSMVPSFDDGDKIFSNGNNGNNGNGSNKNSNNGNGKGNNKNSNN